MYVKHKQSCRRAQEDVSVRYKYVQDSLRKWFGGLYYKASWM